MTVRADPNTKGLWLPEIARKAGAHAVIIGVSDYPHLSGGNAPPNDLASDNGGLGQLEVSAKTAAKVFNWLKQTGQVAGALIATCRLLLAPRPDERAEVEQITGGAYASADFVSVRAAIEAWGKDIFAGADDPNPNIAFFFFSGHGTEHMASPALLMTDILNPRTPDGARKAVALMPLCHAVKTYGINRALFFVDACRDVPGVARTLNITGVEILAPYAYPPRSHDALLCLHSTKAGGSAYQVPGDTATIFGQVVIDALDGPPPTYQPYDTTAVPWRLIFSQLESHVKQRVRQLLAKQTATLIQSVVPYGDPYDPNMLVAEKQGPLLPEVAQPIAPPPTVAPSPPSPTAPPPAGPPALPPLANLIATRSDEILKRFDKVLDSARISTAVARRGPNYSGGLNDPELMHDIFRHEAITYPWSQSLRILDVKTQEPVLDAVRLAKGRSQEVGRTLTAWIDVLVAPGEGRTVWIHAGGENDSPAFAVAIPRDLYVATPVRLDARFEQEHPPNWTMKALSARLHDPSELPPEVREVWEPLWDVQRTEALSDLGQAGMLARGRQVLEISLARKAQSPVAAALAATVLIRCGALHHLHDWPRNLADWFPWLADGPVLWAETLLRLDELERGRERPAGTTRRDKPPLRDDASEVRTLIMRAAYKEARQYFVRLADHGPPRLASTQLIAAGQERFFRRAVEVGAVTDQEQYDLRDACEVVRRGTEYSVCDGLFAAFASRAGALDSREVQGGRQRKAEAPSIRHAGMREAGAGRRAAASG